MHVLRRNNRDMMGHGPNWRVWYMSRYMDYYLVQLWNQCHVLPINTSLSTVSQWKADQQM